MLKLNVLLVGNLNWLLAINWLLSIGWLLTKGGLLLTILWLSHGLHLRLGHAWVVTYWLLDTLGSKSPVHWHGLLMCNDNLDIFLVMVAFKLSVSFALTAEDDAVSLSMSDPQCPRKYKYCQLG
jgi:hypothetical protein